MKNQQVTALANAKNEIVVYQPNETLRLEVRLDNETVWLSQNQMAELFGCSTDNIGLHLKNIYACGELLKAATAEESSVVRYEGSRRVARKVLIYNLDAIISVGYRVNSVLGVRFRQWATSVLREYLLRGYSVNARLNQLEDKVDRRFVEQGGQIAELKDQVSFFVKTSMPPKEQIFLDGKMLDAQVELTRIVKTARRRWRTTTMSFR